MARRSSNPLVTYEHIPGFDGYVEVRETESGWSAKLVTREGEKAPGYGIVRGRRRAEVLARIETIFENRERAARARLNNPKHPPKSWWTRCVRGVERGGGAADPESVCGAQWYRKMSESQRRRATAEAEGRTSNPMNAIWRGMLGHGSMS